MPRIETRTLGEADYDRWRAFVNESRSGSIYSLPEYLDVLCATAGGAFRILGAFRGDELVAGIGLYAMHKVYGHYLSPRLMLYYNGPVVRDYDSKYPSQITAKRLAAIGALRDAVDAMPYQRVMLRGRHGLRDQRLWLQLGWSVTPSYSYEVDVADLDDTWNRIEQNLRRLIKRCEESELTFSEDDGFDDFFRLHMSTHSRKGAPVYLPHGAFSEYYRRLKERGLAALYHVRTRDGRAVASQLVLFGGHPVTHTVSAAADGDYLDRGVNPFLRWRVFQEIKRRGFAANDLTDAALNEVTRFKSQLGGRLVTNFVVCKPESSFFRLREWSFMKTKRALAPLYKTLKGRRRQ